MFMIKINHLNACCVYHGVIFYRQGTFVVVGPDAVLGGCIPRCGRSRTRHHWHGPGPNRDDGKVSSQTFMSLLYLIYLYLQFVS